MTASRALTLTWVAATVAGAGAYGWPDPFAPSSDSDACAARVSNAAACCADSSNPTEKPEKSDPIPSAECVADFWLRGGSASTPQRTSHAPLSIRDEWRERRTAGIWLSVAPSVPWVPFVRALPPAIRPHGPPHHV